MFETNLDRALLALFSIVGVSWYRSRWRHSLPYPPGPPGLPIVGNLYDIPKDTDLAAWTDWGKKYDSDVVHLRVLGKHFVVLNSPTAVHDLLELRANKYSDRTTTEMTKLSGIDWTFVIWNNTPAFRQSRKLFASLLDAESTMSSAGGEIVDHEREAVYNFLRKLLRDPSSWWEHAEFLASGALMSRGYGIKALDATNEYVKLQKVGAEAFMEVQQPGKFLVDTLPILRYVPPWFPGATFQRKAVRWQEAIDKMLDTPLDFALGAARDDSLRPCAIGAYLSDLKNQELDTEERLKLRGVVGSMYVAAVETSSQVMETFFLAMILYPEVQSRAQNELVAALGPGRLPMLDDRHSLPYISALLKELLRWEPGLPLGLPHVSLNNDVYKGCFIPARTMVFANIWAMLHDPSVYHSPDTFQPERFMVDSPPPDPTVLFGFGKRICPGRYLAQDLLFLAIASTLVCFNIRQPSDGDGQDTVVQSYFVSTGIARRPKRFSCSVTPRNQDCVDMISKLTESSDY